jgi:hypothetical protein
METRFANGVLQYVHEFRKDLPYNIAVAILGTSFLHMPVDTGHMMRNTKIVKTPEGEAQLQTLTRYAFEQYENLHWHFKVGGEYKSISRSVALRKEEYSRIKNLSGSAKFKESYWSKYNALKSEGKLTRDDKPPRWFLTAYEEVMAGKANGIVAKTVAEARAKAKQGAYYKVEV